ncbi:TlpA family protein disulfide reductase [Marinilabiliaceae bacterium JC017]|nr:TlpA family protein disulfide reductase [Marinilabiliaceae bacterium JC017]
MKKYLLILAAMLTLTVQVNAQKKQTDDRGYLVKVGEMAPDFTMTLTDGTTQKLSDLRGKIIMLQFTASWCSVCRKEMPHIEKQIWTPYKNKNVVVIGVDRDEPLEKVKTFTKQTGITYHMALDPDADIFGLYADKKTGVTRNVLIDESGKIVFLTRLFNEEEFNALVQKIGKLAQGN